MAITVFPATSGFAAEVGDVDLSRPLAQDDAEAIKAAFWKYAVLVFPEQRLEPGHHLAFAQLFGPLESDRVLDPKVTPHRLDQRFADISNLAAEGRPSRWKSATERAREKPRPASDRTCVPLRGSGPRDRTPWSRAWR